MPSLSIKTIHHPESIPACLLEFLKSYPFKGYQHRYLGIQPDQLALYQYESFQKSSRESHPFYTLEENGKPLGCFALNIHNWHSSLFGCRILRPAHVLLADRRPEIAAILVQSLLEKSGKMSANLLGIRLDCEDLSLQHALTESGFFTIGHSVKLALTKSKLDITLLNTYTLPDSSRVRTEWKVRQASPPDLDHLQRIASTSHQHSHYFNDPELVKRGAERLFPHWVEKCCKGLAAGVLVAEDGQTGTPVGFITLLKNESLARYTSKRAGVIDFIAVDPSVQGQGLGGRLVAASLDWLKDQVDYIEVRTELSNFPAIRLYSRFGFQLVSADVDFHRWL